MIEKGIRRYSAVTLKELITVLSTAVPDVSREHLGITVKLLVNGVRS
jgi:hypothetical protein